MLSIIQASHFHESKHITRISSRFRSFFDFELKRLVDITLAAEACFNVRGTCVATAAPTAFGGQTLVTSKLGSIDVCVYCVVGVRFRHSGEAPWAFYLSLGGESGMRMGMCYQKSGVAGIVSRQGEYPEKHILNTYVIGSVCLQVNLSILNKRGCVHTRPGWLRYSNLRPISVRGVSLFSGVNGSQDPA